MLRPARDWIGLPVLATDGEMGVVKDIYFDRVSWELRYCLVEIGGWIERRRVLLVPESLTLDIVQSCLQTTLTRAQVANSPAASSDMPVVRQYEKRLHGYYGWTPYWNRQRTARHSLFAQVVPPSAFEQARLAIDERIEEKLRENADPHLHSLQEVKGYSIRATDGELGSLEDLILDAETHTITHLVIDTIKWWPSKSVVLPINGILTISWEDRCIDVKNSREEVKNSAEFKRKSTTPPNL